MAIPSYFGSASNPTDNGASNEPVTLAVTAPGSMVAGDLVFLIGQNGAATTGQMAISATGGQTWNTKDETAANAQCVAVWWCEYNGTWSADPSIIFSAQSGTIPTTAVMHVFRPGDASETWTIDQAYQGAGFAAAATPVRTGQTTTKSNTVSLAGFCSADDNTWSEPVITDVTQTAGISGVVLQGGTAGIGEVSQQIGQSFTSGGAGYNLKDIQIKISKGGSPTDNVYIELASSIGGAALATSNSIAMSSLTGTPTLTTFTFSTYPSISSSTVYYFRIIRDGARDITNYLVVSRTLTSTYAGGDKYTKSNNSWGVDATEDCDFIITGTNYPGWITTGGNQYRNTGGGDQSCTFAHKIQDVAAATGDVGRTEASLGNDAGVAFIISVYSQASAPPPPAQARIFDFSFFFG